jgi:peptidyl-prolyl cis-trans isomerase C
MNVQSWLGRCARIGAAGVALWAVLGSGADVRAQGQPGGVSTGDRRNPLPTPAPVRNAPGAPVTPPASSKPVPPNKVMATVNGENITYAQLEPILTLAGPLPTSLPEKEQRELYREALSMLIDDTLLQQYLRKYVPPPSAAEVEKKMAELKAGLKGQKKTLADFCRESKQTEAQLRANLANVLQWAAYAAKAIKDVDVKKYYDTYRDFFDRVTVRASHIVRRVPPTASPSEQAAARTLLLDLRAQIVAGKLDFAAAAKSYSECPTARDGGDVGTFPRKFVVADSFARAAFALQPGQISDVVQTDYGLHLIKVTERKAGGPPSDFNKIKAEVREFYIEDMRQDILVQLRKEARIQLFLP